MSSIFTGTGLQLEIGQAINSNNCCFEFGFRTPATPTGDFAPVLIFANTIPGPGGAPQPGTQSGIYVDADGVTLRLFSNWAINSSNPVLSTVAPNTWYKIALNGYVSGTTRLRAVLDAGTPQEVTQVASPIDTLLVANNFIRAAAGLGADLRIYGASRSDGQIQTDFGTATPPGTPLGRYPLLNSLTPDISNAVWVDDLTPIALPGQPTTTITFSGSSPTYGGGGGGGGAPPAITSNNPTTDGLTISGSGSLTTATPATVTATLAPLSGATQGPFPATGTSTGPWSSAVSVGGKAIPPGEYKFVGTAVNADGSQSDDSDGTIIVRGVTAEFRPPLTYAPQKIIPLIGGNDVTLGYNARAGQPDFEVRLVDEIGTPFDGQVLASTSPTAAAALSVTDSQGRAQIHVASSLAATTTATFTTTFDLIGGGQIAVSFPIRVDQSSIGIITRNEDVPEPVAGVEYSFQLQATGSPTFTLTAGPGWLACSSSGLLTGTPPLAIAPVPFSFTVEMAY